MLAALNDSTRGRIAIQHAPSAAGFVAQIEPAPEPFVKFQIAYQAMKQYDVLRRLLNPRVPRQDRLDIQGALRSPPRQELVWARGTIPARALGREANSPLWTRHRLDFTRSEYATRGTNPGALAHTFSDLQTRFEPCLYNIFVLADEDPTLCVALRGSALNADEIPRLVALIRAAGRAALLE